ncbi:hypothetical protein E3D03_002950 [Paracoccus sp. DMF]|nr:hypothetical protein [Paracoccus sp. DMF]
MIGKVMIRVPFIGMTRGMRLIVITRQFAIDRAFSRLCRLPLRRQAPARCAKSATIG